VAAEALLRPTMSQRPASADPSRAAEGHAPFYASDIDDHPGKTPVRESAIMRMPKTPWPSMNCLALLLALSLLYGCSAVSKGNSPSSRSSLIVVTPATAQIRAGDTQQFVVTFSGLPVPPDCADNAGQNRRDEFQDEGTQPARPCASNVGGTNPDVTWSVNRVPGGNASVGTIDATGLYRAPATLPNPNSLRVTATSAAVPPISATAPLTLYNPIPVVTSVSPSTVPVGSFTLTLNGSKFAKGAQVLFAGGALQTTFVSTTQLTAKGTATRAQLGTFPISVRNPDPGSVSSTAADPVTVTQLGDGQSTEQLAVSPASMRFGNMTVGNGQSQTGTLTAGDSSVTVSSASWDGTGFSLSGISFPLTIPAKQKASFTVTFTPQIAGIVLGTISFLSSATNSPTNEQLAGSGVQPTQNSVSLSWNSDASAVQGYYVYRGKQTGGPYTKISSLQSGTTYTDSTATPGQTYYYVVTARGTSSAESSYSNEVQVGDSHVAAGTAQATTYYVANDGNNANVGTDSGHPFAFSPGMVGCNSTCAGVRLAAGDSVLFNRGDTWRDTLTTSMSGVSGNPLNYGAYGTGANPIINGSTMLTFWTTESQGSFNAYYSTSMRSKSGSVLIDASSRLTSNAVSKASLMPGQWFWDSGNSRTYVRLVADSSPESHTVEGTTRSFAIHNTKNWLTFSNISTYGTSNVGHYENSSTHTVLTSVSGAWNDTAGILLRSAFLVCNSCTGSNNSVYGISIDDISTGAHDIILNNPEVQFNGNSGIQITGTVNVTINGGDGSFNGTASVEGDGISITSISGVNATNIAINNVNAHDNLGNGLSAFGDETPSGAVNVTVTGGTWCHNLRGLNPASGLRFDQNTNHSTIQYAVACNNESGGIVNEVGAHDNKMLYNIVYGNNDGLAHTNGTGVNNVWYGNVSYANARYGYTHAGNAPAAATVKNNILMSNGMAGYDTDGSGGADTVDYNVVFGNSTSNYSGISKPTHDINSDPLFVNAAGKDFRIRAGSPAIGTGANLGSPYNLGLNPSTTFPYETLVQKSGGPGWEIGAFIYVPGNAAPIAAPTGLAAVVD
jgi:hypothetical protein